MRTLAVCLLILGLATGAAPSTGPSDEGLGAAHMAVSCAPSVQSDFDRGLRLLYSFWYERSLTFFDRVIAADPQCRMAYWGAAMTFNHPLWSPPTGTDLRAGVAYLKRGAGATHTSPQESAYFNAAVALFGDADPSLAQKQVRDENYLAKMRALHTAYPDDNSALFYALAIEGTYRYGATPAKIEEAGALAEGVRAHAAMHPGALHYIIHAYDEPGYEPRALGAAYAYAVSAPAIGHALHMPSHTFIALGLWKESNATNDRANALDPNMHGLRFTAYGYLQVGESKKVVPIVHKALSLYNSQAAHFHQVAPDVAADYNMFEPLAIVMNYAEETGDYSYQPAISTDGLAPRMVAARMQYQLLQGIAQKRLAAARSFRDNLDTYAVAHAVAGAQPGTIEVIRDVGDGAYALAAGDTATAHDALSRAAAIEQKIGLMQPAYYAPANEMYARALIAAGKREQARSALKAALLVAPHRRTAEQLLASLK